MVSWLHDPDVYVSLAESANPHARDWGTTRLALLFPDRFRLFPDAQRLGELVLLAGPPFALPALVDALDSRRPCPEPLAGCVQALGRFGLLPQEPEPLVTALRQAITGNGRPADLFLALALSELGTLDRQVLTAASRVTHPHTVTHLPVLVLRFAASRGGSSDAAREVAAELHARVASRPQAVPQVLALLGAPQRLLQDSPRDPWSACVLGAELAGAPPPELHLRQKSKKRRTQEVVSRLLADLSGPLPGFLGAFIELDVPPGASGWSAAVAGWLWGRAQSSGASPSAPQAYEENGVGLSAARRNLQGEDAAHLLAALDRAPSWAVWLLCAELVRRGEGSDALIEPMLGQAAIEAHPDLPVVAACARPDRVPQELQRDPYQGLLLAQWVPTLEVLEALLEMPIPDQAGLRRRYARALAATGDPASLPRLEALFNADPSDHAEARALVAALHNLEPGGTA